jgi:hypothetical protein
MKIPAWVKPGIWGGVIGAIAMTIVGFWSFGWMTGSAAQKLASERTNSALVAAFLPFCVANAQHDGDAAKLVKVRAESSSYTRRQLVMDAGWATMIGTTSPDSALASACSEKLAELKAS